MFHRTVNSLAGWSRRLLRLVKLPFFVAFNQINRRLARSRAFVLILGFCPAWVFGLVKAKVISIELSSACNLKCVFCPVGKGLVRPGLMKPQDHKRIIDLLPKSICMINYNNRGEPTLNPDWPEMVRYAHDKGLYTLVASNGTQLGRYADRIVRSGLDKLVISLEGATQEAQAKYRVGSDLRQICGNIRQLVRARAGSKRGYPREICVQTIVSAHNESQIVEITELARELGVDTIYFKTLSVCFKNRYVGGQQQQEAFIAPSPEYRRKNDMLICPIECRATILHNGDLLTCEQDVDGNHLVGNILEAGSFDELYYSRRHAQMRKMIMSRSLRICRTCSVTGDFWLPELCRSYSNPLGFEFKRQLGLPL